MVIKLLSRIAALIVPTRWLKAFAIKYQRTDHNLTRVPDSWLPPAFLPGQNT